jgi:D-alanyl-D-alanine carboxypeptidase
MFSKFIIFIFLFFVSFFPTIVYADSANSTIVFDMDSGRTLYENNSNNKSLIASITKIMTCIIVIENSNLNDEVTVGDEILKMYGTNIYVEVGEKLTVKDLLYGLMLRSGNDAAIVLATYVGGNEENFVNLMNLKALEIGMNNTIFSNSHGLDDENYNYSTAYDMALLSRYAFQNSIYRKIISTSKFVTQSSLKSYVWYNRMSLLNNYKYCIGGKNGYTPKAGKTLVSVSKKNGITLGIVTLNDSDIYNNHKDLYEKYFNKCKKYLIIDKNNFKIDSSFIDNDVYLKKSFKYVLCDDEIKNIKTFIELTNDSNNGVVGYIVIKLNDYEVGKINIYKKEKKEDNNIFHKFISLFT